MAGLLFDGHHRLWVTARGLGLAKFEDGHLQLITAAGVPSLTTAAAITEDRQGNVWVGTATALVRLRPRPFAELVAGSPSVAMRSVMGLADGSMWIGTEDFGAFEIKDRKVTRVSDSAKGLGGSSVRGMAKGRPGEMYVATETGLSLLDDKGIRNWGKDDGVSADGLTFVLRASNGDLWLRGDGRGVVRLNQTATTNVLKHARATQLKLSLSRQANQLILTVKDNGVGMTNEMGTQASGHYGLRGMKERAKVMNALISVGSTIDDGTTVSLQIPLPSTEKNAT